MIDYLKRKTERWFNRIVHQAIIDGLDLYRRRSMHGLAIKPKRRPGPYLISLAYAGIFMLNAALILAMVYVAIANAPGG